MSQGKPQRDLLDDPCVLGKIGKSAGTIGIGDACEDGLLRLLSLLVMFRRNIMFVEFASAKQSPAQIEIRSSKLLPLTPNVVIQQADSSVEREHPPQALRSRNLFQQIFIKMTWITGDMTASR